MRSQKGMHDACEWEKFQQIRRRPVEETEHKKLFFYREESEESEVSPWGLLKFSLLWSSCLEELLNCTPDALEVFFIDLCWKFSSTC